MATGLAGPAAGALAAAGDGEASLGFGFEASSALRSGLDDIGSGGGPPFGVASALAPGRDDVSTALLPKPIANADCLSRGGGAMSTRDGAGGGCPRAGRGGISGASC